MAGEPSGYAAETAAGTSEAPGWHSVREPLSSAEKNSVRAYIPGYSGTLAIGALPSHLVMPALCDFV